jgi:hypothetical protein
LVKSDETTNCTRLLAPLLPVLNINEQIAKPAEAPASSYQSADASLMASRLITLYTPQLQLASHAIIVMILQP